MMNFIDVFEPRILKISHKEHTKLLRKKFKELGAELEERLPEGRYKALVRMKLEEAAMFTTKAFTHEDVK